MIEWTGDAVMWRLIEAYRVIEATTGKVGPSAFGPTIPDVLRSDADRFTAGGEADRQHQNEATERTLRGIPSYSISMALEAQRWPIELVQDQDKRECLMAYILVRAKDWDWSRYVQKRNRQNPTKKAWIRRTTYRWNEASCQAIAKILQQNGTICRAADAGQVTHEPAEHACKSDKTDLRAWRAERWTPVLTGR